MTRRSPSASWWPEGSGGNRGNGSCRFGGSGGFTGEHSRVGRAGGPVRPEVRSGRGAGAASLRGSAPDPVSSAGAGRLEGGSSSRGPVRRLPIGPWAGLGVLAGGRWPLLGGGPALGLRDARLPAVPATPARVPPGPGGSGRPPPRPVVPVPPALPQGARRVPSGGPRSVVPPASGASPAAAGTAPTSGPRADPAAAGGGTSSTGGRAGTARRPGRPGPGTAPRSPPRRCPRRRTAACARCRAPRVSTRELVAMSYTGTFVRPVRHSSAIAATAASASQDCGESQSMSELPGDQRQRRVVALLVEVVEAQHRKAGAGGQGRLAGAGGAREQHDAGRDRLGTHGTPV